MSELQDRIAARRERRTREAARSRALHRRVARKRKAQAQRPDHWTFGGMFRGGLPTLGRRR